MDFCLAFYFYFEVRSVGASKSKRKMAILEVWYFHIMVLDRTILQYSITCVQK